MMTKEERFKAGLSPTQYQDETTMAKLAVAFTTECGIPFSMFDIIRMTNFWREVEVDHIVVKSLVETDLFTIFRVWGEDIDKMTIVPLSTFSTHEAVKEYLIKEGSKLYLYKSQDTDTLITVRENIDAEK